MLPKIFYSLLIFALIQIASTQNGNSSTSTTTPTSISSSTEAPMPALRKPDWSVKGPMGNCVLLAGNLTFTVNYNTISNSTASGEIPIPKTATATGNCTGFVNSLVLTWPGQGSPAVANSVTLMFIKKPVYAAGNVTNEGTYALTTIFGSISANFPDAAPGQSYYLSGKPVGVLSSDLQSSYKCVSSESIYVDKTGTTQLTFEDVQAQAFHEGMTNDFGAETICSKDTVSSILPIIGYVLAGLLVAGAIGGFAYMKFRQAGYSQV